MINGIISRWAKDSVALREDCIARGPGGLYVLGYVVECGERDLEAAVRRLRHPEPGPDGITPPAASWRDIAAALRLPVSTVYARYRDV